MARVSMVLGILGILAPVVPAAASDPVGIYAIVDKVVFEPGEEHPERIQIWGVFALAKDRGDKYAPPAHGFLYYSLKPGKHDACRNEWADFKKVANGSTCVAFASRYEDKGKVRKAGEKAENPDVYSLGWNGLQTARPRPGIDVVVDLQSYPLPLSPTDGQAVAPGKASIAVRSIQNKEHKSAKVMFELEKSTGEKESSQPAAPGEKETRWTPAMEIASGGSYTLRVWASDGDWKGPVATVSFKGK